MLKLAENYKKNSYKIPLIFVIRICIGMFVIDRSADLSIISKSLIFIDYLLNSLCVMPFSIYLNASDLFYRIDITRESIPLIVASLLSIYRMVEYQF